MQSTDLSVHCLSGLRLWRVEKHPPEGESPIEWLLLTSLDTSDYSNALKIVEMYMDHWEFEFFHQALKTGCQVEELQLKKDERTKVTIDLYMIVSCELCV